MPRRAPRPVPRPQTPASGARDWAAFAHIGNGKLLRFKRRKLALIRFKRNRFSAGEPLARSHRSRVAQPHRGRKSRGAGVRTSLVRLQRMNLILFRSDRNIGVPIASRAMWPTTTKTLPGESFQTKQILVLSLTTKQRKKLEAESRSPQVPLLLVAELAGESFETKQDCAPSLTTKQMPTGGDIPIGLDPEDLVPCGCAWEHAMVSSLVSNERDLN